MDAASLLRQCRKRSGLSQRDLATRAGTSAASICLYEAGDRIPRTDTLIRLIAATGASLQLGVSAKNPIDPDAANRSLQAALALAAVLPYNPSDQIAASFSSLAS